MNLVSSPKRDGNKKWKSSRPSHHWWFLLCFRNFWFELSQNLQSYFLVSILSIVILCCLISLFVKVFPHVSQLNILSDFHSVNTSSFVLFEVSILCESISTRFTAGCHHWWFLMCQQKSVLSRSHTCVTNSALLNYVYIYMPFQNIFNVEYIKC